jgi:hypothetical protein
VLARERYWTSEGKRAGEKSMNCLMREELDVAGEGHVSLSRGEGP